MCHLKLFRMKQKVLKNANFCISYCFIRRSEEIRKQIDMDKSINLQDKIIVKTIKIYRRSLWRELPSKRKGLYDQRGRGISFSSLLFELLMWYFCSKMKHADHILTKYFFFRCLFLLWLRFSFFTTSNFQIERRFRGKYNTEFKKQVYCIHVVVSEVLVTIRRHGIPTSFRKLMKNWK